MQTFSFLPSAKSSCQTCVKRHAHTQQEAILTFPPILDINSYWTAAHANKNH